MRAGILTSCAVLALVWHGQACPAQEAAGRPEAASPERGAGRVGSLSPDEERRAARGRERAAAAEKAAQAAHGQDAHGQADARQPDARQPDTHQASAPQPAAPSDAQPPREAMAAHRSVAVADDGERRPASRRTVAARVGGHTLRSARVEAEMGRSRRHRPEPMLAGDPERAPRVGDVVPPGVPLAPLPRGVRPGPAGSRFAGPRFAGPGFAGPGRVVAVVDGPPRPLFVRPLPPAYPPYPGYPY